MMNRWLLCILSVALLAGCSPSTDTKTGDSDKADDKSAATKAEPKTASKTEPAEEPAEESVVSMSERFDALVKDFNPRRSSKAEREELARKVIDLADEDPQTPVAFDALRWVVTNLSPSEIRTEALDRLFAEHKDDEAIGDLLPSLVQGVPQPGIVEQLKELMENSPHDRVKGIASMAYFMFFDTANQLKEYLEIPQALASIKRAYGEETVEYLRNLETPDDLESVLETIINKYADVEYGPSSRGRSPDKIGELAENKLFSLRYLQVGKEAPNIIAEDLDGKEFQLKDYRGKVVMLDFWGDW